MKGPVRVAVVGATGMVGQEMRRILYERRLPVKTLIPVASHKSVGGSVDFGGTSLQLISMEDALALQPEIALFSAGGEVSKEWAPKFVDQGCVVIDNSSAWRMEPHIPLIVPEVNGAGLQKTDLLIANPNCSTIQLVMVLRPLAEKYRIKRVIVSTYQSVTGTGYRAVNQLMQERRGEEPSEVAYPHPIDLNLIPHCDVFEEADYTKEELKLLRESRKILGLPDLALSATAVRVPVTGGHSESVNIEFDQEVPPDEVRRILQHTPGLMVQDNPQQKSYPMPRLAQGKDEVFVGRIRRDLSHPNAINLFIVSDNLRKGAATNAVQIAELVLQLHNA
jgi:aspartate-semialdehyde dehydrogenase